jgi:hypothetical protein
VQEALVLELVGLNRWAWGAGAEMRRAWGASVVTVVSERTLVREVGFGVLVHHRQAFSAGVTVHGKSVGIVFSYDLWKRAQSAVPGLREDFER